MTNQEILEKAIQKAIDQGYDDKRENLESLYKLIIFNHDFAKALWGEEMVYFDDGSSMGTRPSYEEVGSDSSPYYVPHGEKYKYHLQQMAIAEDPIKYLGEHT